MQGAAGILHTGVPLAAGVVHPASGRLAAAQRHRRKLFEVTAELLDVAFEGKIKCNERTPLSVRLQLTWLWLHYN